MDGLHLHSVAGIANLLTFYFLYLAVTTSLILAAHNPWRISFFLPELNYFDVCLIDLDVSSLVNNFFLKKIFAALVLINSLHLN